MKKPDGLITSDLYIRYVRTDAPPTIVEHRVWDGSRFFASVEAAVKKEGGRVELSSRAEYQAARRR